MSLKQGSDTKPQNGALANNQFATLDSLGAYYEQYYGSLVKQAMGMLGSADAAREAIQEAVVDTAQQIADGTEVRNIGAYLRVAVRFRCLRARCRNRNPLPLDVAMNVSSKRPTSPAEIAELKQDCEDLYDAADQLPSAQKSAFLMAEVRGMDYHMIAASLGRSEHAVRQLLVRARQRIREAVAEDFAPVLLPIARLRAALRSTLGSQVRDLRDFVATKLANLQNVVAGMSQRAASLPTHPVEALVAGALLVAVGVTPGPQTLPAPGADPGHRVPAVAPTAPGADQPSVGSRQDRTAGVPLPASFEAPQTAGRDGETGSSDPGKTGGDESGGSHKPSAPGFSASTAHNAAPTDDRRVFDPGDAPIVELDSPCSGGGGSCVAVGGLSPTGTPSQLGTAGQQPVGAGAAGGGPQGGGFPGAGPGDNQIGGSAETGSGVGGDSSSGSGGSASGSGSGDESPGGSGAPETGYPDTTGPLPAQHATAGKPRTGAVAAPHVKASEPAPTS